MDTYLKLATLTLHFVRLGYWIITEIKADKEKPKTEKLSFWKIVKRIIPLGIGLLIAAQLLGVSIFPFQNNVVIQIFGFILVVVGISTAMSARRTLGTNWAHAAEFQIRKNHTLVTQGIYRYIRHPIYTGMFLSTVGAEIAAGSLLVIPFFILGIWYFFIQAKQEEIILTKQFGKQHLEYKKNSAMFIPYIW